MEGKSLSRQTETIDSKICQDLLEVTEKKYSEKILYASSDPLYHEVLNAVSRRKNISLLVLKSPDLKNMIARAPSQSADDFRMQIKTTSLTAEFLTALSSALERVGRKDLALISALKAHEYGELSPISILRTSEMLRSLQLFSLNAYMLCRFAISLEADPKIVLKLGDSLIELGDFSIGLDLQQYCAQKCEIVIDKIKDLAKIAGDNKLHGRAAYWAAEVLKRQPENSYFRDILTTAHQHICNWSDRLAETKFIESRLAAGFVLSPLNSLSWVDNPHLHLVQSKRHANIAKYTRNRSTRAPLKRSPGERIRVGYFGADFHDHATMHLMSGLLREHDHENFEILTHILQVSR